MAANCSHYAVICLPAVTTSCKVPHYLQRLTREAGPDRGTHGCPQSRRGPQTSPRGGPHAGPGHPGCGALSGPLPSAACGRAEGPRRGPWPGPQPVRRESLYKPPLSLVSRGRGAGGGAEMPSRRPRKQVGRRRGRLERTALRKPTVERGAPPQQAGAPAPSAGSRGTRASRAPSLDRDGLPGRAGVSQGSTRAPRPVRPAPQAQERPGARARLTAVTEAARKT